MKKLIGLGLAVVLFASCSADNEKAKSKLFNRWYNVSTVENGVTTPYEHKSCAKDYIEFNSSEVFRSYTVLACNGTEVGQVKREAGTFTKQNNVVTISVEGQPDRMITVKTATATNLTTSVMDGNHEVLYNYTSTP
jgi:hypothetical protein